MRARATRGGGGAVSRVTARQNAIFERSYCEAKVCRYAPEYFMMRVMILIEVCEECRGSGRGRGSLDTAQE